MWGSGGFGDSDKVNNHLSVTKLMLTLLFYCVSVFGMWGYLALVVLKPQLELIQQDSHFSILLHTKKKNMCTYVYNGITVYI